MACPDIVSPIDAILNGQFFYVLCPYETAFGSQLAFAVILLGVLTIGISIQNKSIVPGLIWAMIGGSAILLQSTVQFGLYSQMLYIGVVIALSIAIYLLLRKLGRS